MEGTIIELQQAALTAQSDFMKEMQKNINLNNKFSAALTCLIRIRETYPHIYGECVSEDDLKAVLAPR